MSSSSTSTWKEMKELKGHSGPVYSLSYTHNGIHCMSGGTDKIVRLWNPEKGLLIKQYKGAHGYEIRDIAIKFDNSQFVSAGRDRVIFVWDVKTGKTIRRYRGHESIIPTVNSVTYNSECTVMASGSYDKTVRLWDFRSRARDPIQILSDFNDSVTAVVIHDTGQDALILAGSVDGCLRTYDIRMGQLTVDKVHHPIVSVKLSNDKKCVLLGCLDNKLRLLEQSTSECLNEYVGHKNDTYHMRSCFSSDDAYVISGSEDNSIYYWDLVESKKRRSLDGHESAVSNVISHGKSIISSDLGGVIKVWKKHVRS